MKSDDDKTVALASKVMSDWNNFLFNVGKQNKVADKHEIMGEMPTVNINIIKTKKILKAKKE